MLKQILLETYKPEEKLLSFISNIPNAKIKTSNGKSELIEKTSIKLISSVIIKIQNENTKLEIWSYQNEEILNKSYYILCPFKKCIKIAKKEQSGAVKFKQIIISF